jgi:hypothetical protein
MRTASNTTTIYTKNASTQLVRSADTKVWINADGDVSRTINAAQDDTATVFHKVDWIEKPGYSATLREASVQSVTPTQVTVTIGGGSYSFNNTIRHRPDIRLEAASTGAVAQRKAVMVVRDGVQSTVSRSYPIISKTTQQDGSASSAQDTVQNGELSKKAHAAPWIKTSWQRTEQNIVEARVELDHVKTEEVDANSASATRDHVELTPATASGTKYALSCTVSGTTVTVADSGYFRAGQHAKLKATGKEMDEIVKVKTVDSSTQITVTRSAQPRGLPASCKIVPLLMKGESLTCKSVEERRLFAENDTSIAFDASNNVRMARDAGYVKPEWISQPYGQTTAVDHQDDTVAASSLDATRTIASIASNTITMSAAGAMTKGDIVIQGSAVGIVKDTTAAAKTTFDVESVSGTFAAGSFSFGKHFVRRVSEDTYAFYRQDSIDTVYSFANRALFVRAELASGLEVVAQLNDLKFGTLHESSSDINGRDGVRTATRTLLNGTHLDTSTRDYENMLCPNDKISTVCMNLADGSTKDAFGSFITRVAPTGDQTSVTFKAQIATKTMGRNPTACDPIANKNGKPNPDFVADPDVSRDADNFM